MVLFSHFSAWGGSGPPCPLFPAEQQHLRLGVIFLWWRGIVQLQSSFLWASCKSQPFWRWAGKGGCVAHNGQSIACGITARVGTPAKPPTPGSPGPWAPNCSLHPRQLGTLGWRPGTFCPGHAHRAQRERHGHSPSPARPSPGKQLGWEHVSGPQLCPPVLHPPLRPGRAGAGATLGSPSPASCQCCSHQGTRGSRWGRVCLGATRSRWQPAGICEGRERQAATGHRASLLLSQPARPNARLPRAGS